MPTHRDEEERILETYRRDYDEEVMEMLDEVSRRRQGDDAFKLHFPVPRDRTMRRLAIGQLILLVVSPVSCTTGALLLDMSKIEPTAFGMREQFDYTSTYAEVASIFMTIGILSLLMLFIVIPIARSSIMTRRYGWRAMQDPIEAQRIAVREGMADVLTANNRTDRNNQPADHVLTNRRIRSITTQR